jgi:hypothetical protein
LAGRHFDIACACPHGDGVGCSCAPAASMNLNDAGFDRGAEGDEGEAKDREGSGAYSRVSHGTSRCKGRASTLIGRHAELQNTDDSKPIADDRSLDDWQFNPS